MGVLDKLAFWKKKDDFDLGKDFGADLGLGPMNQQGAAPDLGLPPQHGAPMPGNAGLGQNMNLGMPEDTGFGGMGRQPPPAQPQMPPGQPTQMQQPFGAPMPQPQPQAQKDYRSDKFDAISAKLDTIRYTLDSINQRLANLERAAYGEHEKKRW